MRAMRWKKNHFQLSRVTSLTGSFLLCLVMMLGFQNCTQPMDNGGVDRLLSEAEDLDFAYDVTFDQVAYMSCSNMNYGTYDSGAYFTLRAGAYRTGGLRLTEAFRASVNKKKPAVQAEMLSMSPANAGTSLQAALRLRSNYQGLVVRSGSGMSGAEYQTAFEPVGTIDVNTLLVDLKDNERLRYMRNGTAQGTRFEASLHFTDSHVLAESIRNHLTNNAFLGLTFTHAMGTGSLSEARSPAHIFEDSGTTPQRSVYGRGYNISFAAPNVAGLYGQFPRAVLSDVNEINTVNPVDREGLGAWSCPAALQFRIIRAEDVGKPNTNCVMQPDPATPSSELSLVRNSLRSEDWYVDMANRCIIPKKTSGRGCYGNFDTVVYNLSSACNPDANTTCVSFASVCYRTTSN